MRYALNDKGDITKCTAPEDRIGEGRCNHILHQRDGETLEQFCHRAAVYQEHVADYSERLSQLSDGEIIKPSIEILAAFPETCNAEGVQPKWYWDGYFYKEDAGDLESLDQVYGNSPVMSQRNALSEEMVSKLLLSNVYLPDGNQIPHAECFAAVDVESGKHVCCSKSFLKRGETLVSAQQLLEGQTMPSPDGSGSISLEKWLMVEDSMQAKFDALSSALSKSSGIPVDSCEEWLAHAVTLDLIMLNNDRHLGNIGLIHDPVENKFKLSPLYDHGSALLADKQCDEVNEFNFWEDQNAVLSDPSTLGMCPSYEYADLLAEWYSKHPDRRLHIKMDAFQNACKQYSNKSYPEGIVKRNKAILQAQLEEYSDQGLVILDNWDADAW